MKILFLIILMISCTSSVNVNEINSKNKRFEQIYGILEQEVKIAMQNNNNELVAKLTKIQSYIEKNITNLSWRSLIDLDRDEQQAKLIKLLIDTGVESGVKSDYGCALMFALQKNYIKTVDSLLKSEIDVNEEDGFKLLKYVIESEDIELLETLLRAGVDVNEKDGFKLLKYVIESENIELLETLLRAGVDVNEKDGFKLLKYEIESENIEFLEELLKPEINTNNRYVNDKYILINSIKKKNKNIIILLEHSDINVLNENKEGNRSLCIFLLNYDENISKECKKDPLAICLELASKGDVSL